MCRGFVLAKKLVDQSVSESVHFNINGKRHPARPNHVLGPVGVFAHVFKTHIFAETHQHGALLKHPRAVIHHRHAQGAEPLRAGTVRHGIVDRHDATHLHAFSAKQMDRAE